MKKINLTLIASIICLYAAAQDSYTEIVRSTIKTEKKALIAEVLQLSDAESQVFWPVYNEYEEKLYEINTSYFDVIQEFADHYENMSDDKAKEIINKADQVKMQKAKLEKAYTKKFLKVLPPKKALRYLQASNKIDVLIDAHLAGEIPLLEDID